MDIFVVVIVAVCAVILGSVVKKSNREFALLLTVVTVVLLILLILENCAPLFDEFRSLSASGLIDGYYIDILLKTIGVTIIGQVTASLCKDADENALGGVVELATKIAILMISMPVIVNILEYLSEILKS